MYCKSRLDVLDLDWTFILNIWTCFGHIQPETTGDSKAIIKTPTNAQWTAICVLMIHAVMVCINKYIFLQTCCKLKHA